MPEMSAFSYLLLALLLVAALGSLGFGLRGHWRRIAHGKPAWPAFTSLAGALENINWRTFLTRGVLTSRLKQRRWSGIAHGLLFCGALILIFGHAVFALSCWRLRGAADRAVWRRPLQSFFSVWRRC